MKENPIAKIAPASHPLQTNQTSNSVNLVQIVEITAENFEEFYNTLISGNLTPATYNPTTLAVTMIWLFSIIFYLPPPPLSSNFFIVL